jgi:hypothetical protein
VGKGASVVDFVIHEKSIRNSSEFFKNALHGSWREAQDKAVHLPEFCATEFDVYHRWLLEGKLYSRKATAASVNKQSRSTTIQGLWLELLEIAPLSDLGHDLLDTNFMDTLSDAILQCTKELKFDSAYFPLGYGSRFFNTIPEGSCIRSLVADSVVWTSSNYELTHLDQGLHHPDFIMAMYKAAVSKLYSQVQPFHHWAADKRDASTTAMGIRSRATGQLQKGKS